MPKATTKATTDNPPPPQLPDASGRFGDYGGRYVAETLVPALDELTAAYLHHRADAAFRRDLHRTLAGYVGRPSPVYFAERLSAHYAKDAKDGKGARIYLKREDLNHTGAHKINNAAGQCQLALRMGKKRIIAETGAGQHGVATATVCARAGLPCVVYMGAEDIKRQMPNVRRMRLLGAEVREVSSGSKTLKDALNEALRDWVTNVDDTFYIIGSVAGPHPYPMMVRDFNAVIGEECLWQMPAAAGKQPDVVIACVGGGSNAMGIFYPYLGKAKLIGVEAGGLGLAGGKHAAPLCAGSPGVLHGSYSYLMHDEDGQILETSSVSAGLDYPGVGPEHAFLKDSGAAEYDAATDEEAMAAFYDLSKLEGIIPALESAHAIAHAKKITLQMPKDTVILINLSGRGDKDLESVSG